MWQNIETQDDINDFMNRIVGFHDSCIVGLHYKSGNFLEENGAMYLATEPYMYITFHSQIADFSAFEIELGMLDKFSINLDLKYTLEIYDALFEKRDDGFYWYSDENGRYHIEHGHYHIEHGHDNVNYWFRCQTIRWRKIPLTKQA